ncbi:MAG: hypothetical protein Q9Q13_10980 [Acidobacteriota bacterium]|nr:hypothetical protein [Acidobacteriota bacterium]
MKVAVLREEGASNLAALGEEVAALLAQRGHEIVPEPVEDLRLVLNLTTVEQARVNYIRPNPSVFVASLGTPKTARGGKASRHSSGPPTRPWSRPCPTWWSTGSKTAPWAGRCTS